MTAKGTTDGNPTAWIAAASSGPTRMAVVPLSRMAVVAPSATFCPLTCAPSSATVQYLRATQACNFNPLPHILHDTSDKKQQTPCHPASCRLWGTHRVVI